MAVPSGAAAKEGSVKKQIRKRRKTPTTSFIPGLIGFLL
jgi:hypothetical protein